MIVIESDSFSKPIIRKDRNNAGGGLLIYSKDYISVIRKNELENHIDESIWVEIQGNGTTFLLYSTIHIDLNGQTPTTGRDLIMQ
jgi:hypothetical protein